MIDHPPPQNIKELLLDLEFSVRQNIAMQPPRIIEALERIDHRRRAGKVSWRDYDPPQPSLPPPRAAAPSTLFDSTEAEQIRW